MATIDVLINERQKRKYKLHADQISFEELELRVLATEGLLTLARANMLAKKNRIGREAMREIRDVIGKQKRKT